MFFFIVGLQPKTIVLDGKKRMCPSCGLFQAVSKRKDHYLALFFLPLLAVKKGDPYLHCSRCNYSSLDFENAVPSARGAVKNRCTRCGQSLEPEFGFCPYCGKEVQ